MSKFYTEIAKYYDFIFPTGVAQLNLIRELAGQPPKDVLDAACGSGGYSRSLAGDGYTVTAIDLDETMIEKLKDNAPSVEAHVLNILDIEKLRKQFDLIFCIGNSLVHLDSNDEIYDFLSSCFGCLKPDGCLLLQIVNYDRVLAKDVKTLPTIKNDDVGLTFERYYTYMPDEHKVDFRTILRVDGTELENHQMLHPIRSQELVMLLERAGFRNIELFGSFNKEEFDPMNSFPLIVTASAN